MKQQSFILLTMLVMLLSCQKDTEILPEATQSGKGTFACMYDGKVFISKDVGANYQNDGFTKYPGISIIAYNINPSDPTYVYLSLEHITKPGIYPIGEDGDVRVGAFKYRGDYSSDQWLRGFSGTIELTVFDTINHLISGKFNAELFTLPPIPAILQQSGDAELFRGDTISIKSGRFDLPL